MRAQLFWGGSIASALPGVYRDEISNAGHARQRGDWQPPQAVGLLALTFGLVTGGVLFILRPQVQQLVDRNRIGLEAQADAQERWESRRLAAH